ITWVTQTLNIQYAQAVLMFLVAGAVYLGMSLGGAALGGVLERAVSPDAPAGGSRARSALDVTAGPQAGALRADELRGTSGRRCAHEHCRHPGPLRRARAAGAPTDPAAVGAELRRDPGPARRGPVAVPHQRPAGPEQVGRLPPRRLPRVPGPWPA